MSRVGKKPIEIPESVKVNIDGRKVIIKGPKGELSREVRPEIKVELKEGKIFVKPEIESKKTKAFWGLTRSLLYNMVKGVIEGYEKKLEIKGLGYKAKIETVNKKLISKDIVGAIIHGYEQFLAKLQKMGLNIRSCGGETADIGDLVRTIVVDSTLIARMKRTDVINPERIQAGDVIVGLSSAGQATYEDEYNSGIGSNGLTLARHGLLVDQYKKFEECYSPEIDPKWVFFGTYKLTDALPDTPLTIGDALLSPTRTYAPILLKLFQQDYSAIHAIYHNTGGAQSKCLKYGCGLHYIKDRMFPIPSIFTAIQQSSHTPWKEMYQVFNMGHRMEIVCPEQYAREEIIPIAQSFGVQAKIVGRVEKNPDSTTNQLTIQSTKGVFNYHSTPC